MKTKNGLVMVSGDNTIKTNIFGRLTEYGKRQLMLSQRKKRPVRRVAKTIEYDF